jgi:uncharacterized protein (DUF433 family)
MVGEHIEQREGVHYVVGTRISLDSIVYAFREGCSPETIRENFDGLSLADVYGATAFYLDHQADIDAYLLHRKDEWTELVLTDRQALPDQHHSWTPLAPREPPEMRRHCSRDLRAPEVHQWLVADRSADDRLSKIIVRPKPDLH